MKATVREVLLALERAVIGDLDEAVPAWAAGLTTDGMLEAAATRAHLLLSTAPAAPPLEPGPYRRRAVDVEAIQFDPSQGELPEGVRGWRPIKDTDRRARDDRHGETWTLGTSVGDVPIHPGDWIVTEHGKQWPCPPEVFVESYEKNPEAGLQTKVNAAMERLREATTAPALGHSLETTAQEVVSELSGV